MTKEQINALVEKMELIKSAFEKHALALKELLAQYESVPEDKRLPYDNEMIDYTRKTISHLEHNIQTWNDRINLNKNGQVKVDVTFKETTPPEIINMSY